MKAVRSTWSCRGGRAGALLSLVCACVGPDPLYQPPSADSTTSSIGSTSSVGSSSTSAPPADGSSTSHGGSSGETQPPPSGCVVGFSDDFDDGRLDARWTRWSEAPSGVSGVVDEGGGRLTYVLARESTEEVVGILTSPPAPLDEGYTQLEVLQLPELGSDDRLFFIAKGQDCQTTFVVYASYLETRYDLSNVQFFEYDRAAPLWLRLVFEPGVIRWEISSDGASWVSQRERSACDMSQSEVLIWASSGELLDSSEDLAIGSFSRCDGP